MRRRIIMIAAAAVIAAGSATAVAVSLFGSGQPSITARGTVTVFANPVNQVPVQSLYPDVSGGSQVVIVDSAGHVIGTGSLIGSPAGMLAAENLWATEFPGTPTTEAAGWIEVLKFAVKVPGGLPRYGIEVGHNRGTIWESAAEIRRGASLTLGSMTG